MSDENNTSKNFKYYFIGLIIFIVVVVVLLMFTGRGSLA